MTLFASEDCQYLKKNIYICCSFETKLGSNNIIQSYTHQHTRVGPTSFSLSVGSLSVLTGCGPGLTTDRQAQGGEETPGSAKHRG